MPAFGEATLSNCELEQIHLAGSIQPHGALLLVDEPRKLIVLASANAAGFLGYDRSLIGRSLDDLPGDLVERIGPHLSDAMDEMAVGVRCHIGRPARAFDGVMHRPKGGGLIIELEEAGPSVDTSSYPEDALQRILAANTLASLCDRTAEIFKDVTGYDRVMVYRFDEHGHGEVMAEAREPDLESYLGNRYPASDIPQIARRLYERNRVRVLQDVDFAPEPLVPGVSPITGEPLDMSLCLLRSSSPIHVQYLKNMGVRATLVVSLMVGGTLWGLLSCHHYRPRFVHFEQRALCEILAEAVATRIAALESFARTYAELSVRRLEQRLIAAVAAEGDWQGALFDGSSALLEPVSATGAALIFEGNIRPLGEVPSTAALRDIGRWLDARPRRDLVATSSFGLDAPEFADLTPIASGLLAVPLSSSPGEYIVWLRPERKRTVTWGGNPFEPHLVGDDPSTLSPRRSFAQWHQRVEGTAEGWSAADVAAARLFGETLADLILQFRSVRMLIAEDQLEQIRRQVHQAGQAVVIADPDGQILQVNAAFAALLPPHAARPRSFADMARVFTDSEAAARALGQLVRERRAWTAEIGIERRDGVLTPILVRADAVFAPRHRLLGFVLLFADQTDRKAAEAARQRFQEAVIERRRPVPQLLGSKSDLRFRKILNKVVENAQVAALETTESMDVSRIPVILEAVRLSVARTAKMLGYLIWHTNRRDPEA
jgi:light-regulated signal transduction histidine kinase (bacteriophytochrome)